MVEPLRQRDNEPTRRTDPVVDRDAEVAQNHRVLAQAASALLRDMPLGAADFSAYAGMMTGEPGGGHLIEDLVEFGALLNSHALLTDLDIREQGGMQIDVLPMAADETVMTGETERTRARLIAFRGTNSLPRTRTPFIIGTVAVENPRREIQLFNVVVLGNGVVASPPRPINFG